jgi:hypothetical protein
VTGPKDVIGSNPIGALNDDLRLACLEALKMSRDACRDHALAHSWENSARQFIGNIKRIVPGEYDRSQFSSVIAATANG